MTTKKPLKAQLDELTDRQVVDRCMELAGVLWAYNELGSFEGYDTERNQIRRELKFLRSDPRRYGLIKTAIEATVAAWRGKPIVYNIHGYETYEPDAEDDETEAAEATEQKQLPPALR